jgi:periplasmic glucans biosynthesis protein
MRRLGCLTLAILMNAAWSLPAFASVESAEINLDYVAKKAEERARKPFRSPRADLPDILRADKLDYDKFREIRFRHDQALWSADKLPFVIEFFHPGYIYEEPVHINEFSYNNVQSVRFVQDFFDYGNLRIKKQIPANTGYAGFRILFPLNQPDRMDELGAFLGASYFRLLGKGQRYGESARGLALDCGEPDRPEEFPIFTDWWLGKPQAVDKDLRLLALLDSVSCTGAYEFRITPGETTVTEVEAVIYLREPDKIHAADPNRKPLATLGIAPLTSMFWFGKNSERKFDDYRPEVHDSDGLLMKMENGETLWRPLNNASVMRHQRFAAKNIRGYGLMQRERDFADYQDIFNFYHLVPSVWVVRRGDWGEGDLHLVELSTQYEGLDNVVAFWDPKIKPQPLQPFHFAYALHWTRETDIKLSTNMVVATRIGADPRDPKKRQFVVDFTGPRLAALAEGLSPEAVASCSDNATITETQVFSVPAHNPCAVNMWRVTFKMESKPDNKDPVDLRCTLKKGEEVLTETWTFHWSPP